MSGLTEQFVVLLMFSCFFALCEATLTVTVDTGEDVSLQCQGPRDANITVIGWIRPDLESDGFVFFFRDNRPIESYQLPSFRGRVELRDPEMKNGDTSVILKNVNINDAGTYECFVKTHSSGKTEFRQSVTLKVTESGTLVSVKTAKTGEDVTLQCQSPRDESITAIQWSRADLQLDDFVFYFRDNRMYEQYQLPSFRGRVELRDPEVKNGDASVILKNVNINDAGTYECDVLTRSSGDTELRQSVILKVTDPDGEASSITAETLSMFKPLVHLLVFIPYCISTVLMVSLCPQRSTGRKPPEDDLGLDEPYDDVIADVTTEHHF